MLSSGVYSKASIEGGVRKKWKVQKQEMETPVSNNQSQRTKVLTSNQSPIRNLHPMVYLIPRLQTPQNRDS